jgi:hypothetical protein
VHIYPAPQHVGFRVRELDRGRAVKILNVQEFMQDAGYELPRIPYFYEVE